MLSITSAGIAGLGAGIIMGAVSELGYQLKIFKSNLFLIDGAYLSGLLNRKADTITLYLLGIPVHLLTGIVFGVGYAILTLIFNLNPGSLGIFSLYVLFLWLSMLFFALPIAGQGVFGRNIGPWVWADQLLVHIAYGLALGYFLFATKT